MYSKSFMLSQNRAHRAFNTGERRGETNLRVRTGHICLIPNFLARLLRMQDIWTLLSPSLLYDLCNFY